AAALSAGGCGSADAPPVCEPRCPDNTHCTLQGCTPDNADEDLAVAPLDMSRTCAAQCMGATPHCGPSGLCVPCLEDKHCPVGQICKTVGQNSICAPGCGDDARCGGGSIKCCNGSCTDTAKDTQNCGACG